MSLPTPKSCLITSPGNTPCYSYTVIFQKISHPFVLPCFSYTCHSHYLGCPSNLSFVIFQDCFQVNWISPLPSSPPYFGTPSASQLERLTPQVSHKIYRSKILKGRNCVSTLYPQGLIPQSLPRLLPFEWISNILAIYQILHWGNMLREEKIYDWETKQDN